jgi:hypothetical protein
MSSVSSQHAAKLAVCGRNPCIQLLALAALFASTIILVGPAGDFPLDDDWSYATSVRTFVTTGEWRPGGWTSMPLISNALWAAPICAASACTFVDLRITTLLASALLFAATYFLLKRHGEATILPLMAATLMAFNPIAYALSFTFMSDILFSALLTLSALLLVLSLERDSVALAALGTALALAATLSRQLGLCVPLAYLVVRMLQPGRWRPKLVSGLVPLILCAGSLLLLRAWLQATGRLPALYNMSPMPVTQALSAATWRFLFSIFNLSTALLYAGLFSLPMLLLTQPAIPVDTAASRLRKLPLYAGAAVAILAIGSMVYLHRIMPLLGNVVSGNILVPQGIGPLTLRDTYILGLPNVAPLPRLFWIAVTLLSLWGAFQLVIRSVAYVVNTVARMRQGRLDAVKVSTVFPATAIVFYLAPLLWTGLFDRHLLPALPLILSFSIGASGSPSVERYRVVAAALLTLAMTVFAVLATHDYMAWNRARWSAISELQKTHDAGPANLDGGFEYNGLFSYDPSYRDVDGRSWWWVQKDDYQITFGPIAGMSIVKSYTYRTLLPPGNRSILVLHK